MDNTIINLANSKESQKFATSNLIHIAEYNRVMGWIDERLKENGRDMENSGCQHRTPPARLHETITVLGTRGSGKTSFLLSILDGCRSKDIEVIDIIDPTIIEEKGHIFLTILSEINTRVAEALRRNECSREKADYINKAQWDKKLKTLAKGLPAMDIINNGYREWCDPEYVMNTGLQDVYAARKLEANFHELLRLGLRILNKKAFIIALDDIDIDFRKGWPVLETIRKYMTTPYMITLLSGDMHLFSKAVRKQQWKNFGKALLKNECEQLDRKREYNGFVTEMETQYMLKVLQPARRIHLTTLKEKIDAIGPKVQTIFINAGTNNSNDIYIIDFYNTILGELGIKNPSQTETYRSFLLGLPLRSQIRFMSVFAEDKQPADKLNEIVESFLSEMYENGVDADMVNMNDKYLMPIILRLLVEKQILDESYQLQPTTTNLSLNITLMVLSFIFSQKTLNNPYLIFDYFIRIGYIRNILSVVGYRTTEKNTQSPSMEHLCEFVSIYRDTVLRDITCLITAYLQADPDHKSFKDGDGYCGIIKLPGLKRPQNKPKDPTPWRIDDVFKDEYKQLSDIAFLPLSISQNNKSNSGVVAYSIYTLIAAIGELIRGCNAGYENSLSLLSQLAQLKSYPMPAFGNGSSYGKTDIETPENDGEKDEDIVMYTFKAWVEKYPDNHMVPPHLLGKISTRMFYALRNIEGRTEPSNLAESMHARVVIFMNSVLIEEAKEYANEKVYLLNINNPNFSDYVFNTNLQKIIALQERYPDFQSKFNLSRWICACPLLLPFLNPDDKSDLNAKLKAFTGIIYNIREYKLLLPLYDKLSEVTYLNTQSSNSQTNKPRFNRQKVMEMEIIIEIFKESGVKREWLDIDPSKSRANNKKIRKLTKERFVDGALNYKKINELREYIAENNIVW